MVMRVLIVLVLIWTAFGFAAFALHAALAPLIGTAGAAAATAAACLALAGLAGWFVYRKAMVLKAEYLDPLRHAGRRAEIIGGQVARAPARYPFSTAGVGAGAVGLIVLLRYLRRLLARI